MLIVDGVQQGGKSFFYIVFGTEASTFGTVGCSNHFGCSHISQKGYYVESLHVCGRNNAGKGKITFISPQN